MADGRMAMGSAVYRECVVYATTYVAHVSSVHELYHVIVSVVAECAS